MVDLNTRPSAPIENDTIATQLGHRTIRAFTDRALTEEELTTLFEVARQTASSSFLQQCTILRITDPEVREKLHQASGQPYVGGTKGELLVFVADQYRNARIREEAGIEDTPLHTVNLFLTALHDALLSAQNVVVAAESMGLGTCYLGSIHANPELVIEALNLPKLTFPVLGLLIGHPDQSPQYKPRLPLSVTVADNTYPCLDSYEEALAEYDQAITEYYDLRDTSKRAESFSTLVRTKVGIGGAQVSDILRVIHKQGFDL